MSTGSYVGHMILFSLPVIGWIACIVIALSANNLNKRNYAKAIIVLFLISLAIFVVLSLTAGLFMYKVMEYINGNFGDIGFSPFD